ncbi:MAG: flavodoxin domain-containing protein [Anaerolineaceae bacterium]
MPSLTLITYATRYGSTQEVAKALAVGLQKNGAEAECRPMREVENLKGYSTVVLGSPIYLGALQEDLRHFLSKHQKALSQLPVAIFALGPITSPHNEAEWQEAKAQLHKQIAAISWFKPRAVQLFGGKFDHSKIRAPMKWFTGKIPESDLRDWATIEAWAAELPLLLSTSFTNES